MKQIAILLFLFLIFNSAFAQVTFQKEYTGNGPQPQSFVTKTSDGGYAMAAATGSSGAGDYDIYLVRTDNLGNILWTRTYGGPGPEYPQDIHETSDSGFIISGETNSFGQGNFDVYLIRTDKNGDTLWTRTYGNTLQEDGWGVQQTADGGFIVSADWGSSSYDYMIRTNSAGDTLWTKIYDQGKPFSVPVVLPNNKGFIMSGAVYSPKGNGDDLFIYKTDSLGNVVWYRTYGGENVEYAYRVIQANDGGYIAVGFTHSFGYNHQYAYAVKIDTGGNLVWSKMYGDSTYIDEADAIVSTGNGYTFLCLMSVNGSAQIDQLINIDNSGNVNWAKNYYGVSTSLRGNLQQTADSGYIFSASDGDFYLIKTDKLGNSGCNDSSITVHVITPPTNVDTLYPVNMPGTIVGNPHTIMGNGTGTATTICLSTGAKNITPAKGTFLVYPNPCTDCEIREVVNANDLIITDVMGRNIPVSFAKSAQGYLMYFPEQCSGIYLVRNVKTGEVAKVVKL